MYIVRDKVQLAGRTGVFLVTELDSEHDVAEVISLAGHAFVQESVPFHELSRYREVVPLEAI